MRTKAGVSLWASGFSDWYFLGPRAGDVRRQNVELQSLIDRLPGVLGKQTVAPGNKVVEVRHHCLEHECRLAIARDKEREERIFFPCFNAIHRLLMKLCVRAGGKIHEHLLDHFDVGVLQRLYFPETF